MTLEEARAKYINQTCYVNWDPLNRPKKKDELIPLPTKVKVKSVYLNAFGEIFFTCHDTLFTPFNIARLEIVADKTFPENTMKLSEYIKELQKIEKRNPNLLVVKSKADTSGFARFRPVNCDCAIGTAESVVNGDKLFENIPERSDILVLE